MYCGIICYSFAAAYVPFITLICEDVAKLAPWPAGSKSFPWITNNQLVISHSMLLYISLCGVICMRNSDTLNFTKVWSNIKLIYLMHTKTNAINKPECDRKMLTYLITPWLTVNFKVSWCCILITKTTWKSKTILYAQSPYVESRWLLFSCLFLYMR